jgi:hypothetical protein
MIGEPREQPRRAAELSGTEFSFTTTNEPAHQPVRQPATLFETFTFFFLDKREREFETCLQRGRLGYAAANESPRTPGPVWPPPVLKRGGSADGIAVVEQFDRCRDQKSTRSHHVAGKVWVS